jgi:DNA (cytosine-5)-methyltransferase 1
VDDGLSAWVAKSRIAVGSPRGTIAASLIVEAFGDAVLPQIPEAIGRAILRVERALAAITAKPTAANDNNANQDQAIAAA